MGPVLGGAGASVGLVFPLAALCVGLFRFPVPFVGYASGWGSVPEVLYAVRFYGVLGGFPLLLVAGGIAGAVAVWLAGHDRAKVWRWTFGLAGGCALTAVLILATLDYVIGPW